MTRQVTKIPVATLVSVVVLSSGATVHALNYADFPANLQTILDQRIGELNANGGICLAGRVTKSDGTPIRSAADVQVNLYWGGDVPTRVYDGGWFVMARTLGT